MASPLEAQFGFSAETTWGTRVTPARFLPFVSESLKQDIEYKPSESYRSGRIGATVRSKMKSTVSGDIEMELAPQGIGLWLTHALGAVSSTTAGSPYTHTITPTSGQLGKGLTIQIGRTDNAGTMRPFDYTGCKISEWELSCSVGDFAMLKTSIVGQKEDTGQSLASASYPSNWAPFSFTHGSLTVGGTATPVTDCSITGNNGLNADRFRIQATNPSLTLEPLQANIREYTGSLTADFVDLTAYNRFVNQTAAALVLTFNAGSAAQLVVTMNVEFDGETPNATGVGSEVMQNLPFTGLHGTADSSIISISLVNADSTA